MRVRQEDVQVEASLDYIARPYLQTNEKNKQTVCWKLSYKVTIICQAFGCFF
jgi:hypothetical protein